MNHEAIRNQLIQEVLAAWFHYRATGLHTTAEEIDAWLEKLEASDEAEVPQCHR